jgi:glucose/arabinose dehydrogenase
MRTLILGTLIALTGSLLGPVAHAQTADHRGGDQTAAAERATVPKLRVRRLVTGLDHPWDVRPIGHGRLLYTQRDRATVSLWTGTASRTIEDFPRGSVWVSGETGLMGLEVDPGFADNHRFYTCQGGTRAGGGHDVRIMRWTLDGDLRRVTASKLLLGRLPATSGRHGGCRLLAAAPGRLYVGTGDAATGTNPESTKSLGGKTLCLDPRDGSPCGSNPFVGASNRNKRYVHTYGHRNVQGLDQRRDGTLWSIEQGTYRDDEVNRLHKGGDYGYNPVPGYNEEVPMTDKSLPGKQWAAVWRSGNPTIATSGGGFVYGKGWGRYNGSLAVAALKGERVVFLRLSKAGRLLGVRAPAALRKFGRIRTVVDGPGSVAYVTTDNGNGHDVILAVHARL